MAMNAFVEAGRVGGGEPTTSWWCELGFRFVRGGFSEFLLPGVNNSHTVEVLEMSLFFFLADTARRRTEVSQLTAICKVYLPPLF